MTNYRALLLWIVLNTLFISKTAFAQGIFYNDRALISDIGGLMGQAQVSLAYGTSALWHNPAGLVFAPHSMAIGNLGLRYDILDSSSNQNLFSVMPEGYLAYAWSGSTNLLASPMAYGFSIRQTSKNSTSSSVSLNSTLNNLANVGSLNWAGIFPDGINRSLSIDTKSNYSETEVSFAIALAIIPGLRLGIKDSWTRTKISTQGRYAANFQADAQSGNTVSNLIGKKITNFNYEGEVIYQSISIGLQAGLPYGISLGIVASFNNSLGRFAKGKFLVTQYENYHYTSRDATPVEAQPVLITKDLLYKYGQSFGLRQPHSFRMGIAWTSDIGVLELDFEYEAATNEVLFPSVISSAEPLLSSAEVIDRRAALMGGSLGMGFEINPDQVLLIGLRYASAGAEGLFSSFKTVNVTAGYHVSIGRFSIETGIFSEILKGSLKAPQTLWGDDNINYDFNFQWLKVVINFSYIFD